MTSNFHTPLAPDEPGSASNLEARFGALDEAITNVIDGTEPLANPSISDMSQAQHDHTDAAGGGQLSLDAINVGAGHEGKVPVAQSDGSLSLQSDAGIPTGSITMYGGNVAPTGWALCQGQEVPRTDPLYSSLFAIIGTTYGVGDGTTTFNLPDLEGRFPLGHNASAKTGADRVDGATRGDSGGEEEHTLTNAELPTHNHRVTTYGDVLDNTGGVPTQITRSWQTGAGFSYWTTENIGSDDPHNNLPPYLVVNFMIKL